MQSNTQIIIRIRPDEDNTTLKVISHDSISIISPTTFEEKLYKFNQIFTPSDMNVMVFQGITTALNSALHQQQNLSIFMYGQSGSGKSYTLGLSEDSNNNGIMQMLFKHIFNQQKLKELAISIILIHQNRLIDMLNQSSQYELKIRIGSNDEPYIQNLTELIVASSNQAIQVCEEALSVQSSSTIKLLQIKLPHSIITVVDLAASNKGKSHEETKIIGSQLTALGAVISAINRKRQSTHIPYRDSKLTYLLKSSLQPHCKVILIGTIFPNNSSETFSTLGFLKSITHYNDAPQRSRTPKVIKPSDSKVIKTVKPSTQTDLNNYLIKLLTKINSHAAKLINNNKCLDNIDVTKSLEEIIAQVQQVSHQLLDAINTLSNSSKQVQQQQQQMTYQTDTQQSQQLQTQYSMQDNLTQSTNKQVKTDSWIKAIQYLYTSYEDLLKREDKLLKEKLLYIVNENDEFDVEDLRKKLFPQKTEQQNSLFKTLGTLRKYTNTMSVPTQIENKKNFLISQIYQREVGKEQPSRIHESMQQFTFSNFQYDPMSKFKPNQQSEYSEQSQEVQNSHQSSDGHLQQEEYDT